MGSHGFPLPVVWHGQGTKDVPPGLAPKHLRLKEAEAMGKFTVGSFGSTASRPVPTSAKDYARERAAYQAKVRPHPAPVRLHPRM